MLRVILIIILALNWQIASAERQSLSELQKIAKEFLQAKTQNYINGKVIIDTSGLDPRIQLAACDKPLQPFLPKSYSPTNTRAVGIKCTGEVNWSVYIPVEIKVLAPTVVAARPLKRGQLIDFSDISTREINIKRLANRYFTNIEDVIGKQVKHNIHIGKPVLKSNIEEPLLVKRGEIVTISAKKGMLRVTMRGEALQDGRLNNIIRVKNLTSGKIIQGVVLSNHEIHINLDK